MKIVSIGTGEIGYDLASVLSKEKHNVTVLDRQKETELNRIIVYEGSMMGAMISSTVFAQYISSKKEEKVSLSKRVTTNHRTLPSIDLKND